VVQRGHHVLHPEAGPGQLEVEQPGHRARAGVGQQVRGGEVAVNDLGGEAVGARPPPPRAAGRAGDQAGLLGGQPGRAKLANQGVDGRVTRPDPARVGPPVAERVCERHVRQRGVDQPDRPAEPLEGHLAPDAGPHPRQPPVEGGGPGLGLDHRLPVGRGHRLGYLERKIALPQPPQDPVFRAHLGDGQEAGDAQHVALVPVTHEEGLVVDPLLVGQGDVGVRRETPPGQQGSGELQFGGTRRTAPTGEMLCL
jgi:hypothetical protein